MNNPTAAPDETVPPGESTESQQAIRSVVGDLLAREDVGWEDLASSGMLGLTLPQSVGGEGLGIGDAAVLLGGLSTAAVELPLWETLVASLAVGRIDEADLAAQILSGVESGERLVVPALAEAGAGLSAEPQVRYSGERVSGRKIRVAYADRAAGFVVTARAEDGSAVLVWVDGAAGGVALHPSRSSRGQDEWTVAFDEAPARLLTAADAGSDAGSDLAGWTLQVAVALACVRVQGLVAGARDLTAGYVAERTQFGRKLAEFQAVSVQTADLYIASRTLTLAADNAVWRLAAGLPADSDVAVAAYWATREAAPALHTCHHLHGGFGVDETYPLHCYYGQVTDLVHLLGGRSFALAQVAPETEQTKNLELTEAQRELKATLRDYFGSVATHEQHQDMMRDRHGPTYQDLVARMGADGWMGVGWPTEYGGHGFGEVEQTIFANEAQYADVHLPSVTLQTVGPTLQTYGTAKQKEMFLSDILAGKVHFAIGYSEPDAGTDLASLRTSARLVTDDGDPYYLVNGQKMWTTGGHAADYIWLAVRTDPDAPKHKGISILIVDTSDPGFSSTPIITCDGSHHVNATYYHDVKVPADMLVGEENQGWRLITTQLNHERVMLGPAGRIEGLRDRVLDWAAARDLTDRPDVAAILGEVTAVFRVNELLNWEVARAAAQGAISVADASSSKVFAADQAQSCGRLLAEIVHAHGDPSDPETAELTSYLDSQARRNLVLTFGGGVTEIQKELISMFGLKLPRVPR